MFASQIWRELSSPLRARGRHFSAYRHHLTMTKSGSRSGRSRMLVCSWTLLLSRIVTTSLTVVSSFSTITSFSHRQSTTSPWSSTSVGGTPTRLMAASPKLKPTPYDPTYKSKPPTFNTPTTEKMRSVSPTSAAPLANTGCCSDNQAAEKRPCCTCWAASSRPKRGQF